MRPLRDVVRGLRGELTQEQFARLVGVAPSMVAHIETGRRSISVDTVEAIAAALDLSPDDAAELRAARDAASADLTVRRVVGAPGKPGESLSRLRARVAELTADVAELQAIVAESESRTAQVEEQWNLALVEVRDRLTALEQQTG